MKKDKRSLIAKIVQCCVGQGCHEGDTCQECGGVRMRTYSRCSLCQIKRDGEAA